MSRLYFDESLPTLVRIIAGELGADALHTGRVIRDSTGRLAFFSRVELEISAVERLSSRFRSELGIYSRDDRPIATVADFGARGVLDESGVLSTIVEGHRVALLDRRLVGADWLVAPAPGSPPPPRIVFASMKGGVGRSTALAVAAASRAARGDRVLAIDLDMEAPGLGTMLLDARTTPEFGTIDVLAEGAMASLDEEFYSDLIGSAPLSAHRGRIDVIPAIGQRSIKNPADILSKLARAYTEGANPDGGTSTIADRVRTLVDHFSDPKRYDAILVDSRAGLHETTASSIMGLGAEVLLFGLDEPQTFQAYAALLGHLARFVPADGQPPEWLERLTGVQSKAPEPAGDRSPFSDRWRRLFEQAGLARQLPRTPNEIPLPAEPLANVPWGDDPPDSETLLEEGWAVQSPLAILDDTRFRNFDPLPRADQLEENACRATFGTFLNWVDQALAPDKDKIR